MRSFSPEIDPTGWLTAGPVVDPASGSGDSGDLGADLTDLVLEVGAAAREQGTGVILLIDEVQFPDRGQLEALVMALHKSVQRALPITLVGAGLPQIAELAAARCTRRGVAPFAG